VLAKKRLDTDDPIGIDTVEVQQRGPQLVWVEQVKADMDMQASALGKALDVLELCDQIEGFHAPGHETVKLLGCPVPVPRRIAERPEPVADIRVRVTDNDASDRPGVDFGLAATDTVRITAETVVDAAFDCVNCHNGGALML